MICRRCQHENPAGVKFCGECGARLEALCPACQVPNPPTNKFCHQCGSALAAAPPAAKFVSPQAYTPKHLAEKILTSKNALEGERKQVTVLFADLKGSMELLADRDPEEARKILDPVLERMMEAVHRYEGTVNQVMGDGIMALFGAPLAHEDHAVRACYSALAMQEAIRRHTEELRRTQGLEVQIRVGLNSGEVVVRAIGSDLHMDYTAVGQTTHLAARMEQLAPPGTIRLTAETLRLADGFVQVNPLGPIPVKGMTELVEIFELAGAGLVRRRLHAAAGRGLTRFVGRETELEALYQALDRAGAGQGQVVALVGEAGVGKSRLVWELTHSHRSDGRLILESGSVSYGKATAYLPVLDVLKTYFQIETRDDARKIREKVTGKILTLDSALEPFLPAFLVLLDVPPDGLEWQTLDPTQRRQRTLEGIKRLILRESQLQPVLLVFEDLHWIDSETQAFLDSLVEGLPTARILLLTNYRPEYQHGWGSKSYYTQLRINPLPAESAQALLEALLGEDRTLQPLKQLLTERTQGNPFFLEESVRRLVETKSLVGELGTYRLVQALPTIQVPATVQALLAARIDRLTPEQKRLLQSAAVIGKDVPFALLKAIADVPETDLQRDLVSLQAAEFLYEASLFPDLEYTFRHALTHEVAYQGLLHERRRALHVRIVGAIERLHSARLSEKVEQLAHHAFQGELWEKGVTYLHQSGTKAAARSAYREAVLFLEQALKALEHLPEDEHTLGTAIDIHVELGPALQATKGFSSPEAEAAYRRAHELCERLGETPRLYPVLWGTWLLRETRGQIQEARELGERLLVLARREDDPALILQAHHALWATLLHLGDLAGVEAHVKQGLKFYDPREHRAHATRYGGHDPAVCGHTHCGRALWLLGYPEQAVVRLEEGLALARELSDRFTIAQALAATAWIQCERGNGRAAEENADASLSLATDQGFSQLAAFASAILGRLLALQGRPEGLARLEAARSAFQRADSAERTVFTAAFLADAYGRAGQTDRALEVLAEGLAPGVELFYEPEIHRLKGELLLTQGLSQDAEASFRRAIEIARARQSKSLELRGVMGLAKLLARQGKRGEAHCILEETYGWFTEGFDTADLKQAKALLQELSP
ncbi:MAG TPA: adenylate/guanylate cyclase domain-containing protein [Candidatus Methylomirabilis sp.]|nr:adenylate/guanylate cyclase domain-containing protein [Candidatus Methylomirabilis sp.]